MRLPTFLPAFASLALAVAAVPAQKVPDTRIESRTGTSKATGVQVLNAHRLHVIWSDDRNGAPDILRCESRDQGVTWSTPARVDTDRAGAAASTDPHMAYDLYGSAYAVWVDKRNGKADIYFNRSRYGAAWDKSDRRLDTDTAGAADSTTPQVAAHNGIVCVVWADTRNGKTDIYFNRSRDSGTTWLTSDIRLDSDLGGKGNSSKPKIVTNGSVIHVVWQDDRNGKNDIYWNMSTDAGFTWLNSDLRLDGDKAGAADSTDPRIAMTGFHTFVTWADRRSGAADILLTRFDALAQSWLAPRRVNNRTAGTHDCALPQLGVDHYFHRTKQVSYAYVAWQDARHGQPEIYSARSIDSGVSFAAEQRISKGAAGTARSLAPQLGAKSSFCLVAWTDERNGRSDIYWNRTYDWGQTWLAKDVRIDTGSAKGAAHSVQPSLSMAGSYWCTIAWLDERRNTPGSGRHDVFFNLPVGVQRYGTGLAGQGGWVPLLAAAGGILGGRGPGRGFVQLRTHNGLGGATGASLIGLAGSNLNVPFLGGRLLVNPLVLVPIQLRGTTGKTGAGWNFLDIEFPALPSLVGARIHAQTLIRDAAAAQGVSMSNGVTVWIG